MLWLDTCSCLCIVTVLLVFSGVFNIILQNAHFYQFPVTDIKHNKHTLIITKLIMLCPSPRGNFYITGRIMLGKMRLENSSMWSFIRIIVWSCFTLKHWWNHLRGMCRPISAHLALLCAGNWKITCTFRSNFDGCNWTYLIMFPCH